MRFINAIHGCFVPTTSRTYGRATLIRCLSEQICDKTIYKVSEIIVQFFVMDFLINSHVILISMLFRKILFLIEVI